MSNSSNKSGTSCYQPPDQSHVEDEAVRGNLMILYIMTTFVSISLNSYQFVYRKYKNKKKLHQCIQMLALSNMALSTTMPFAMYNFSNGAWDLGSISCQMVQITQLLCVFLNRSIQVLVVLERYILLTFPHFRWVGFVKSQPVPIMRTIFILTGLYIALPLQTVGLVTKVHAPSGTSYFYCSIDTTKEKTTLTYLFMWLNFIANLIIACVFLICSGLIHPLNTKEAQKQVIFFMQSQKECGKTTTDGVVENMPTQTTLVSRLRKRANKSEKDIIAWEILKPKPTASKSTTKIIYWIFMVDVFFWTPVKIYTFIASNNSLNWCTKKERNAVVAGYIIVHYISTLTPTLSPLIQLYMMP